MEKMCEELNTPGISMYCRECGGRKRRLADQLDAVVFIEKCGPSKEGIHHLATGPARDGKDAPLTLFLEKMTDGKKLSVGTGDVGNEIGFGKIYEEAREIVPVGRMCKCPAQEGIITALYGYLLPATT